jgi:hypothetical protein
VEGSLPVLNLSEARYECVFGRGCDGICCRNGRPGVYPDEAERITANLAKFLPQLSPRARAVVEKGGYLSRRRRLGLPMLRVVDGWCVFFREGCVLHKVGAAEGDKYRYKPAACALFPLARDEHDRWYVRQAGYKAEKWDLFCLDPQASPAPAADSLREEVALAARYDAEVSDASPKRSSPRTLRRSVAKRGPSAASNATPTPPG